MRRDACPTPSVARERVRVFIRMCVCVVCVCRYHGIWVPMCVVRPFVCCFHSVMGGFSLVSIASQLFAAVALKISTLIEFVWVVSFRSAGAVHSSCKVPRLSVLGSLTVEKHRL